MDYFLIFAVENRENGLYLSIEYDTNMKKIFLVVLMIGLTGYLDTFGSVDNNVNKLTYLTEKNRPKGAKVLPLPPTENSAEYANDVHYYEWGKQQRANPEIRGRVLYADTAEIYRVFSSAMGIKMSIKKTPEILKLVRTAAEDAHIAADEAQKYFKRTKPFVFFYEPSMKGAGHVDKFKDKHNSYPSGHSTRGWAYAMVLSDVAPNRTEALDKCASDFAMNRVIMGRHWFSDIEAGKALATAVISKVRTTKAYKKQLLKARAEYEACSP